MRSGSLPPAARRLRDDTRGATITEYALILFLLAVVGAGALRIFGSTVSDGLSTTEGHLKNSEAPPKPDDTGSGEGAGGSHTTLRTSHGAKGGAGGGGAEAEGFGGPRVRTTAKEESPLAKFAMIALGVIGAAAAFFAAMRGKHAR
jgi:Flp pilus assembly pilin Flp